MKNLKLSFVFGDTPVTVVSDCISTDEYYNGCGYFKVLMPVEDLTGNGFYELEISYDLDQKAFKIWAKCPSHTIFGYLIEQYECNVTNENIAKFIEEKISQKNKEIWG